MKDIGKQKGPMAWMTINPVAANLLMVFLIIGGLLAAARIKQEVFPEFDLDTIQITVSYPGASPAEVEQGVILSIEEAVRGLDGVDKVICSASEGMGSVSVELLLGTNSDRVLQDVQNAVDRITTLSEDAESPQVKLLTIRRQVITLVVYGDQERSVLREIAETARDEMLQKPDINQIDLAGIRPLEISIEIPKTTLRAHNLTLQQVANIIRQAAVEIPGGSVKADRGEILLRMNERRDWGREYADIPIVSKADGTKLRLGDVAIITDGFADTDSETYYDGKPAVMVQVYRVGNQTPIEVADAVKEYKDEFQKRLPEGVGLAEWYDYSSFYRERMELLLRNAYIGLILVMILLGLFLEIRLAFWVMMGLPTSFLGAFIILPLLGVSINMLSMFAFIMALGMVVDDAIVVGENVYKNRQKGMPYIKAAIEGAREMAVPVTFSILTNIAAFMPLMFVPGTMGKFFKMIPMVVVSVFVISLVEALLILPAHLAHQRPATGKGVLSKLKEIPRRSSAALEWFVGKCYRPFLKIVLRNRYITLSVSMVVLVLVLSLVFSGRIRIQPMPTVESNLVSVYVELPFGSPVEETRKVQERLLDAARRVIDKNGGEEIVQGIVTRIGESTASHGPRSRTSGSSVAQSHVAQIQVYLVSEDDRDIGAGAFSKKWRKETGEIAGLEKLEFAFSMGGAGGGKDVEIELSHLNMDVLEDAAAQLAEKLRNYSATNQIDDGFAPGKPQLDLKIRPEAESLGLTTTDIGRQLRNSFYGAEALRQQRGRNEVKVMVRLPENERQSEDDIEEFLVSVPGGELPLREAADIERGNAYTVINRRDGRRIVTVSAKVDPPSYAKRILDDIENNDLPDIIAAYPELGYSVEGEQAEFNEAMASLKFGFMLAMLAIFAMLAIPFNSYIQPVIIMISIPFGIVGAVLGHVIMGYSLSIISMMGIVALSGVVVNDSLILIDYINHRRKEGVTVFDAAMAAGQRRFRPIMLTSLTTFFGLAPMIFEKSIQARFMIPMGISLGYGILFATLIALLLVPALYLIIEDLRSLMSRLKGLIFGQPETSGIENHDTE